MDGSPPLLLGGLGLFVATPPAAAVPGWAWPNLLEGAAPKKGPPPPLLAPGLPPLADAAAAAAEEG